MSFEELFAVVKQKSEKYQPDDSFLAIQVTVKDLNRAFYVEIKDGEIAVEPYEYIDRQANLIISSENLIKLIEHKLNPVAALTLGKLKVEGNLAKAAEFSKLFKKI